MSSVSLLYHLPYRQSGAKALTPCASNQRSGSWPIKPSLSPASLQIGLTNHATCAPPPQHHNATRRIAEILHPITAMYLIIRHQEDDPGGTLEEAAGGCQGLALGYSKE